MYLIRILDVDYSSNKLLLYLELVETDLRKMLNDLNKKKEYLPETAIKVLLKQLIEGVAFCHNKRIIHRDLKSHNILVDSKYNLKIAE